MVSKREEDFLFKVLLIGDSKSGKFDLIREYLSQTNDENTNQTSSKDFTTHIIQIDKKAVKLQIWDTAGDPKFRSLIIPQFKGTKGIILVYGTDTRQSFLNIEKWVNEIKEHAKENVARVLIANSVNAENEIEVTSQEGKEYAAKLGIPFFEVSKKHFSGVKESFLSLGKQMLTVIQEEIRKQEEEEERKRMELEGNKKGKKTSAPKSSEQNPNTSESKQVSNVETKDETKPSESQGKSYDYLLKILLVGVTGVGKTSLVNQLTKKEFTEELSPSSSAKVSKRTYKINDKTFKIEIWDTPGPLSQWSDKEKYYKDTDAIVFVYDITDKESFAEIDNYITETKKYIPGALSKTIVGNKTDLSSEREVNLEEAKTYAESQRMQIIETSAKEVEAKSIFSKVITDLVSKAEKSGKLTVGKKNEKKDDKGGCSVF